MGEAATFENGIYRQGPARLSDLCGEKGLAIGNSNFEAVVRTSVFVDKSIDRKSTRLNSSHGDESRMPSSA